MTALNSSRSHYILSRSEHKELDAIHFPLQKFHAIKYRCGRLMCGAQLLPAETQFTAWHQRNTIDALRHQLIRIS